MHKIIKTYLLMLIPIFAQAQTSTIDSLQQALQTEKNDTSRVRLLNVLSFNYVYSRPDTALMLAQQALILAKKASFIKGEAASLSRIAIVFWVTGNFPKALQLNLEALKKAEAAGDNPLIIKILSNMGGIYSSQGDYRQAVAYTIKSLASAESPKDQLSILYNSLNLGDIYEKLNRLDSAQSFTNRAYDLAVHLKDEHLKGAALGNLGNIYSKKGLNTVAMQKYRLALPIYKQEEDGEGLCEVYLGMAALFQKEGKQDSCLYYAKKSLTIAQKGGFTERVMKASNYLTTFYTDRHNVDSAFVYQSATIAAKDSIFNQEKAREIQNLGYEETMRQQQLIDAKEEAKTQLKFNMLFGGLFTVILMAFLLYRNNRQKHKTNLLLFQQKTKVESTLQELKTTQAQLVQSAKMASLGELTAGIAHEIQNPLNFVNNFSEVSTELLQELRDELQKGDTAEALAIAIDVKENLQKINHHGKRAASIVKGMLQHSGTNSNKKEVTDINALIEEYLRLSYHGLRAKNKDFNANLIINCDRSISKLSVVPQEIGRVLLNVFNNAFYATQQKKAQLNGQYQPEVKVSTQEHNGRLEIKIRDNGTGIPEDVKQKIFQPFFTTKPTGEGTGLGLSLSYDIITKGHGGELKVESNEGEGAWFIIRLPIN